MRDFLAVEFSQSIISAIDDYSLLYSILLIMNRLNQVLIFSYFLLRILIQSRLLEMRSSHSGKYKRLAQFHWSLSLLFRKCFLKFLKVFAIIEPHNFSINFSLWSLLSILEDRIFTLLCLFYRLFIFILRAIYHFLYLLWIHNFRHHYRLWINNSIFTL